MKDSMIHQARTLSALTDISRYISTSLDYKVTAYRCLMSLSENLELEKCALLMPDEDKRELSVQVSIGWKPDEIEDYKVIAGEDLIGKVMTSGMPIAFHDIGNAPPFKKPELSSKSGEVIGFIAVPVVVNQQPLGVLTAYRVSNATMLDEDVNVMKIVASILSQTLKLAEMVESKNSRLRMENKELHAALENHYNMENFISRSPSIDKILAMIKRVSDTDANVLLRGESGTGKSLIAKNIHFSSQRHQKPFIVVNCSAIPENLIESELFGHEKGSFTGAVNRRIGKFEAAEGGTLFLDEIGELKPEMQAKLLRIIQEGTFERVGSNITLKSTARLIFATNTNLEDKVKAKAFREDLYYRLMVIPIFIPPLRERKEDILPLAAHFLNKLNEKYHKTVTISREAMEFLERHAWPGNVRELEHTIERAVILTKASIISENDIPLLDSFVEESEHVDIVPSSLSSIISHPQQRALYERVPLRESQIVQVLEESAGIQTLAARKLGISLRQLRYAIHKFNVDIKSYKR